MGDYSVDKRALVATGVILLIPLMLLAIWGFQGQAMQSGFAAALRTGAVKSVHGNLQGKQWSAAELATIEVLKIPLASGQERALSRSVHSRGRIFVSPRAYEYQATIRDSATDIVHVFGYRRSEPRHWQWQQIHPESMETHLQRLMSRIGQTKQLSSGQPLARNP
ncbi:MAG: hypothetical protein ACODAD_14520 [Planctomycetota bacterium]